MQPRHWRPRSGWLALFVLGVSLAVFESTDLDLWIQDRFYDAATARWLVNPNEPVGRLLFYNGPKAIVWTIGLTAVVLVLGPEGWRRRWQFNRRGLGLAIAVLATMPALAGLGKNLTNVFCPAETRRYGGDVANTTLCSPLPERTRPQRKGNCFPAGHASGGFALMGLLAIRTTRTWARGAIVFGFCLGWWMGIYQMMKGAHFLSHTTTTLLLSWIVIQCWRWGLERKAPLPRIPALDSTTLSRVLITKQRY